MKVHQFIIASLAILLLFGIDNKLSAQPAGSAGKVETEVKLSQNVVPAGDTVAAAVVMHIEEGWHVNAHEPTLDYLIGTELKIDDHPEFTITEIQYPKSEQFSFAFAGEPLDVYHGSSPVFVTLKASSELEPDTSTLDGSLRVQACDDKSCLPPSTIEISIPVEVAAGNTGFKSINQELFSAYAGESISLSSVSLSDNSIASMFNERGTILAFLGIFLIGLALNLTPCVYPMLSVTVSLFGGRADQQTNTLQSFGMASVYVLGIVSMYSALGVAAAYTGGLFGSWLQSSVVLGAVGIILLAMALSMYELQPPLSCWTLRPTGACPAWNWTGSLLLIRKLLRLCSRTGPLRWILQITNPRKPKRSANNSVWLAYQQLSFLIKKVMKLRNLESQGSSTLMNSWKNYLIIKLNNIMTNQPEQHTGFISRFNAWLVYKGSDQYNRQVDDRKQSLFAGLSGRVLEIGPGTGIA